MNFKGLGIGFCILFSTKHIFSEEIKLSKLDLDMFKLCMLATMHEHCKSDPKTHERAPFCNTMQAVVSSLNNFFHQGTMQLQNVVLPVLYVLKTDLEKVEVALMTHQGDNLA